MDKVINPQEWIDRGYRRYDIPYERREYHKLADFLLQKLVDDKVGKRYYITVYCYDRRNYLITNQITLPEFGYMPSAHYSLRDGNPFFNIEMNAVSDIDQVEHYFDLFWTTLGRPYYEKFENQLN